MASHTVKIVLYFVLFGSSLLASIYAYRKLDRRPQGMNELVRMSFVVVMGLSFAALVFTPWLAKNDALTEAELMALSDTESPCVVGILRHLNVVVTTDHVDAARSWCEEQAKIDRQRQYLKPSYD